MTMTLHRTQAVDVRQRNARARRSLLRIQGIDAGIIAATADDELLGLFQMPAIELVSEATMLADEAALAVAPRIAHHPHLRLVDDHDDQSPDELESTRIARHRLAGTHTELRHVYTGPTFGLGGNYDGPDAA